MKKVTASVFTLLLVMLLLVSCGSNLPDGVDATAAKTKAKEVINVINARDYEGLTELLRPDLRDLAPPETWELQFTVYLDEMGAFKSFGDISFADKGETEYGHLFSAIVVCEYENKTVTYEVGMDTDLELTGLALF